jgi:hypothetical protein
MPVCPNCEYEYYEGITICPDCNTPLVDENSLNQIEELSEEDWVLVYTSGNELEVEMMKGILESAGLSASVLSQQDHNFPAPGDFSVVKLFVKKNDVQAAINFIHDAQQRNSETQDE